MRTKIGAESGIAGASRASAEEQAECGELRPLRTITFTNLFLRYRGAAVRLRAWVFIFLTPTLISCGSPSASQTRPSHKAHLLLTVRLAGAVFSADSNYVLV